MRTFDLVIRVPFSGTESFESRLLRHLSANHGENLRVQVKPMEGDGKWTTLSLHTSQAFVSTERQEDF